ncbi:MAG: hypothetical protein ACXAE3_09420 [Candidatus Kariarchaeaceae archaeon]|jgi:hypothetical protein
MSTSTLTSDYLESRPRLSRNSVKIQLLSQTISERELDQWSTQFPITIHRDFPRPPYLMIELHDRYQRENLLAAIEYSQRMYLARIRA